MLKKLVAITLLFFVLAIKPVIAQERDPDTYNYYPLVFNEGIGWGEGLNRDIIIGNMVRDQGYEVSCAENPWRITKEAWGDVQSYFLPNNYKGPVDLDGIDDKYIVDLEKAKIPLFRGVEELSRTNKVSSFEGFFGASSIPDGDTSNINLNGVANNLLSLQQQCLIKHNNLYAANQICDKLENPGDCSLLNKQIKESSYKTKDLYAKLNTYKKKGIDCEYWAAPAERLFTENIGDIKSKITKPEFITIQNAIQNLSIDMDLSYRLAFLIISPQQDPKADDPFYFIQSTENNKNKNEEAPIFVAFKIPNFVANDSDSISYQDSSKITGMLLRTEEQNIEMEKDIDKRREELLTNILKARKIPPPVLDCRGMPQCMDDDLREALIDIINGSNPNCEEEILIEPAGDLASPAKVTQDNKAYKLLNSNFKPLQSTGQQLFNWQLRLTKPEDIDAPIGYDGQGIKVSAYLIAPLGTNLEYLNNALQSFWTEQALNKMEVAEGEKIPDRYPIAESEIEFFSSKPSHTYIDNYDCYEDTYEECDEFGNCNIATRWVCRTKTFGVSLIEENKKISILGARLGWLIRKIQETLRPETSEIWAYIHSCETTEDLFLGRCGERVLPKEENENTYECSSSPTDNTGNGCDIQLACNGDIVADLESRKDQIIKDIQNDKKGGIMSDEIFELVLQKSLQKGWNPALVLALGWEETGWGAVGRKDKVLGCLGGESSTNPEEIVINQINCLSNSKYFSNQSSCHKFMCYYSGDPLQGDVCPYIANPSGSPTNPVFYQNLPYFYQWITTGQKP